MTPEGEAAPGATAGGLLVRELRDGDERGVLDLFQRVFGVERSPAHWRWKFGANPAGREAVVAVDRDGRIVGQFAGLPARGWIGDRPGRFSQLLDHMVDPGLRRGGVYAALTHGFSERYAPATEPALHYGFNLPEVLRIQQRIFPFECLHPVQSLRLDLAAAGQAGAAATPSPAAGIAAPRIEQVERFPAGVDRLWARAAPAYEAAIARDARYLNWRYADCPDVAYALLLARRRLTRAIAGLAVVRLGWPHEPIAALVDWVVPGAAGDVWAALAGAAARLARAEGLPLVRAWLPPTSPDAPALAALGFHAEASPFLANVWSGPDRAEVVERLRRGWHYTMGDSDIF